MTKEKEMTKHNDEANCKGATRYQDDDGRVVADMSQVVKVHMMDLIAPEGLRTRLGGRRPGNAAQNAAPGATAMNQSGSGESIELTDGELKALMKASLKAAFLLAGVFIAGAGLFILFCVFVWFR
jgi:hypothetical protein